MSFASQLSFIGSSSYRFPAVPQTVDLRTLLEGIARQKGLRIALTGDQRGCMIGTYCHGVLVTPSSSGYYTVSQYVRGGRNDYPTQVDASQLYGVCLSILS